MLAGVGGGFVRGEPVIYCRELHAGLRDAVWATPAQGSRSKPSDTSIPEIGAATLTEGPERILAVGFRVIPHLFDARQRSVIGRLDLDQNGFRLFDHVRRAKQPDLTDNTVDG